MEDAAFMLDENIEGVRMKTMKVVMDDVALKLFEAVRSRAKGVDLELDDEDSDVEEGRRIVEALGIEL